MADNSDVRDNFKTIRLADSEYALIAEAASLTRTKNPSKVIRDGAVAHARQIVESAEKTSAQEREELLQRLRDAIQGR